jgi:hypothetical protein
MQTKFLGTSLRGTMLAVLALVLMMAISSNGTSTHAQQVPTEGEVIDIGVPKPTIICKWELPDMDSNVAGIQYVTPDSAALHDDDPTVSPTDQCFGPEDGVSMPGQNPDIANMMQVVPNAEDLPEGVRVEVWMAVTHVNGISNIDEVFWHILHPDGSQKIKLDGSAVVLVPPTQCAALGTSGQSGTMFNAAHDTGQVSAAAIDETTNNLGLVSKCQQRQVALYHAEFFISKHQPCGEYTIEANAGANGRKTQLINHIDVLCFINPVMDFDTAGIDWGQLVPGTSQFVSGDFDMATPALPSLKNTGNHPMGVGLSFDPLVQITDADGDVPQFPDEIDTFDACFGTLASNGVGSALECIDPISAFSATFFAPATDPATPLTDVSLPHPQVLCANDIGKLDFSVHVPFGLAPGDYAGNVMMLFRDIHDPAQTTWGGNSAPCTNDLQH